MQACEFRRDDRADILDAARRPFARELGRDVIRLSRRPALGGRGLIVELVGKDRGGASGRVFTFYGHPSDSWELVDTHNFVLSPTRYRQLTAFVDRTIATDAPPPLDTDQVIVCTDGPGLLTERVRDGVVRSLTGSCPPAIDAIPPNRRIEAAVQDMLCRQRDSASRPANWAGRRCYSRLRTMAEH